MTEELRRDRVRRLADGVIAASVVRVGAEAIALHFYPSWTQLSRSTSQQMAGARLQLRTAAWRQSMRTADDPPDWTQDLQILPPPNISISHCEGLAGFAIAKGGSVGLDLEPLARFSTDSALAAVHRIASEDELALWKDAGLGYLWCAKEAVFKALSRDRKRAKVLSQIQLDPMPVPMGSDLPGVGAKLGFSLRSLGSRSAAKPPPGDDLPIGIVGMTDRFIWSVCWFPAVGRERQENAGDLKN